MGGLDSKLKLVMMNNSLSGSDIDNVINSLTALVNTSGHHVVLLSKDIELKDLQ
jgi:hypothetical protein